MESPISTTLAILLSPGSPLSLASLWIHDEVWLNTRRKSSPATNPGPKPSVSLRAVLWRLMEVGMSLDESVRSSKLKPLLDGRILRSALVRSASSAMRD